MGTRCLALLLGGCLLPGLAAAQDWTAFVDRGERFCINLPAAPEVREFRYQPQRGADRPARRYAVRDGARAYAVTVVNLEGTEPTDIAGSVAWEAWRIRRRGGSVSYDAYAQSDRIGGHELHLVNPDATQSFVGIYLHDKRLYTLEATGPAGAPGLLHFLQSLIVIDAEGRPIRYGIEPDGSRGPRVPYPDAGCH